MRCSTAATAPAWLVEITDEQSGLMVLGSIATTGAEVEKLVAAGVTMMVPSTMLPLSRET
jgi:hypothetical protein